MKSKGKGSSSFADAVSSIEAKASKMDKSKKGKKLVSSPVKKSREPKTKNNYRTGRKLTEIDLILRQMPFCMTWRIVMRNRLRKTCAFRTCTLCSREAKYTVGNYWTFNKSISRYYYLI